MSVAAEFEQAQAILDAVSEQRVPNVDVSAQTRWLPAFDESDASVTSLSVYAVGTNGAKLVAYRSFAREARSSCEQLLRRGGLRCGGAYGGHEYVWVADKKGCCVWSATGVRMHGTGLELTLATGSIYTSDIRAVVSFIDDDLIHRGVRLELVSGKDVLLVDEHDRAAELDPTYNRDNLELSDARWVSKLGRAFATWLHVPHRDEAFPHDTV